MVGQHRLYHNLGPIAKGLHDGFCLDQGHVGRRIVIFTQLCAQPRIIGAGHNRQTLGGDLVHHGLAGLEPVHATQVVGDEVDGIDLGFGEGLFSFGHRQRQRGRLGIGRTIGAQRAARVHQTVTRNSTAFGHTVVVEIMRARNLDRARAEFGVGIIICDDRNQPAVFFGSNRYFAQLPDNGRVTVVRRMYRHGTIAQHGFRAGRRDRDVVSCFAQGDSPVFILFDIFIGGPARERVFKVPHVARGFDVFDLKITDRGFELWVPVYQTLAAIDEAFVIHLDKNANDGVVKIAILALGRIRRARHGKCLTRPIAGRTKTF